MVWLQYVCMYVCMYAYMYVCIYVYMRVAFFFYSVRPFSVKTNHGVLGAGPRLITMQLLPVSVQKYSHTLQYYLSNPACSHAKVRTSGKVLLSTVNLCMYICVCNFFIMILNVLTHRVQVEAN